MAAVTMLGLGAMGTALAKGFVAQGHEVTVWNRTPGRAASLVKDGAQEADSLAEAVAASGLIVACLLNYDITAELLGAPDVSAALEGRTVVNLAGGTPAEVRAFEVLILECRGKYFDGKLMTYPSGIGETDTVIYYSGPSEVYESHCRTMDSLAGAGTYLGENVDAAAVLYQGYWAYYYSALFGFMESAAFLARSGVDIADFAEHARAATADVLWHIGDVTERVANGQFSGDQAEVKTYIDAFAKMKESFVAAGLEGHMATAISTLTAQANVERGSEDIAALVEVLSTSDSSQHRTSR